MGDNTLSDAAKRQTKTTAAGSVCAAVVVIILFFFDGIQPILQCVHLILYISNNGSSDYISVPVHNIGGGVAGNFRNEVLVEIIVGVRGDIQISDAFFLQDFPGGGKLLLTFTGIGSHSDQVDILLFELLVQLFQLRQPGRPG